MSMITITIVSHKGGTAKTSLVLHLASAFALFHKKKCLVVDADPQADLTAALGFLSKDMQALPAVLDGSKEIKEVVQQTSIKNLSIVKANSFLEKIDKTSVLSMDPFSHERLRKALVDVRDDYDFCFIDIPPTLDWLCDVAFYASDYSIIATTPEPFSILAMERLAKYHKTVNEKHSIEVLGIAFSFWDKRGAINAELLEGVNERFPGKVFKSKVRRDIFVSRAVLEGQPVFLSKSRSRAAKDLKKLAAEVMKNLSQLPKKVKRENTNVQNKISG